MEETIQILAKPIIIERISIYNFTSLDEQISIEMLLEINREKRVKVLFYEVRNLDIDSDYYGCSESSRIMIEDISKAQMEDILYSISISEEIMTFYCKRIELANL